MRLKSNVVTKAYPEMIAIVKLNNMITVRVNLKENIFIFENPKTKKN